jgi:AcrR family transcriptional regulator
MQASAWLISRDGHRRVGRAHRELLLDAASRAVVEIGYPETSVKEILARAGVSRGTFYALFADRDECVRALAEDVEGELVGELELLELTALDWEEQVTAALSVVLELLDDHPQRTRGYAIAAAYLDGQLARPAAALADLIGRGTVGMDEPRRLAASTAHGLARAAWQEIRSRAAEGEQPLTAMLGRLVWLIVLPYRGEHAAVAARERASSALSRRAVRHGARVARAAVDLPRFRLTYRTARVLEVIAGSPGATNRVVAERAGVTDAGQISKLLGRLDSLGLITSDAKEDFKWASKTWRLTPRGATFVERMLPGRLPGWADGPSGGPSPGG